MEELYLHSMNSSNTASCFFPSLINCFNYQRSFLRSRIKSSPLFPSLKAFSNVLCRNAKLTSIIRIVFQKEIQIHNFKVNCFDLRSDTHLVLKNKSELMVPKMHDTPETRKYHSLQKRLQLGYDDRNEVNNRVDNDLSSKKMNYATIFKLDSETEIVPLEEVRPFSTYPEKDYDDNCVAGMKSISIDRVNDLNYMHRGGENKGHKDNFASLSSSHSCSKSTLIAFEMASNSNLNYPNNLINRQDRQNECNTSCNSQNSDSSGCTNNEDPRNNKEKRNKHNSNPSQRDDLHLTLARNTLSPPTPFVPSSLEPLNLTSTLSLIDPRPLLLFDMNGVLIVENKREKAKRTCFTARPEIYRILSLRDRFRLGIFSSATSPTVNKGLVSILLSIQQEARENRLAKDIIPNQISDIFDVGFCRIHCIDASRVQNLPRTDPPSKPWSTLKPLKPFGLPLESILLIDNEASKGVPGEEANMLVVPTWEEDMEKGTSALKELVRQLLKVRRGNDLRQYSQRISRAVFRCHQPSQRDGVGDDGAGGEGKGTRTKEKGRERSGKGTDEETGEKGVTDE